MKIEVRSIAEYSEQTERRVKITVRLLPERTFVTFEDGINVKVTRGQIMKAIREKYGVKNSQIVWPAHIKVPQV